MFARHNVERLLKHVCIAGLPAAVNLRHPNHGTCAASASDGHRLNGFRGFYGSSVRRETKRIIGREGCRNRTVVNSHCADIGHEVGREVVGRFTVGHNHKTVDVDTARSLHREDGISPLARLYDVSGIDPKLFGSVALCRALTPLAKSDKHGATRLGLE